MSAIPLVSASQRLSSVFKIRFSNFLVAAGRDVSLIYPTAMNLPYKKTMHSNIFTRSGRRKGKQHSSVFALMAGKKTKKRETVVPDPDYRISVVLLGLAGGLAYQSNLLPAAPIGLLGLLLLFQTSRVRFVFDDEALEVKIGDQLDQSGENVFVGGKNRWKYSTFVNWELWWPSFPILVYFKETQTKPEGQIHFFPVIFNGKQLYDVMVERAGPSKTSGPEES